MRSPRTQWCIQADTVSACSLSCSNCTRLLLHNDKTNSYFMSPECFEKALKGIKGFLYDSPPDAEDKPPRRKVIGMIGGEPLLHPQFDVLVDIMVAEIPEVYHRGLWTSKAWPTDSHPKYGSMKVQVERLLGKNPGGDVRGPSNRHKTGFLNWNMHTKEAPSRHQPLLLASRDVVKDRKRRWELISQCWIPRKWSSAVTQGTDGQPKYFFCEVAAHFDRIFKLGVGIPAEPGCWDHDLGFEKDEEGVLQPVGKYAEQIRACCERCGGCVPLPSRLDHEEKDDVSTSNYVELVQLGSKALKRDQVVHHEEGSYEWKEQEHKEGWAPFKYLGNARPDLMKVCEDRAKEKAAKEAEKKAQE